MRIIFGFMAMVAVVFLSTSCGKAEEVANDIRIRGRWLMTQSEHTGTIEKNVANESMVLAFKDGKAAFSPADSLKGQAVFATLSACTQGPRPYATDNNQLVFQATPGCPEKRVTILQLDGTTLKFTDPDNADVTRVFTSIDDATFNTLVKASDRKL